MSHGTTTQKRNHNQLVADATRELRMQQLPVRRPSGLLLHYFVSSIPNSHAVDSTRLETIRALSWSLCPRSSSQIVITEMKTNRMKRNATLYCSTLRLRLVFILIIRWSKSLENHLLEWLHCFVITRLRYIFMQICILNGRILRNES